MLAISGNFPEVDADAQGNFASDLFLNLLRTPNGRGSALKAAQAAVSVGLQEFPFVLCDAVAQDGLISFDGRHCFGLIRLHHGRIADNVSKEDGGKAGSRYGGVKLSG